MEEIEGLEELENAIYEQEEYEETFARAFACGIGVYPKEPKETPDELRRRYPRADAYLKARAYSRAGNERKARAGREAMERLERGEEHTAVIAKMKKSL